MRNVLRMFVAAGLLAFLAVSMSACGGGNDTTWWWGGGGKAPDAPTGILATFNSPATISWNPVSGATSYNIYYSTAPDFTKETGTKISNATSPHIIPDGTLSDNTTYYFFVTAVNSAGKESVPSLKVSAIHATFAQTDLEGPWNVTLFWTGIGNPATYLGWLRMNITLDPAGNATINYYEDSNGNTIIPMGALSFTIDADGIVTQGGDFGGLASHNVMSSNKQLIVGTNTLNDTVKEIRIFQRADTVTVFSDADLINKSFAFHQLGSGAEVGWVRGEGSINASREVTITSIIDSAGGGTIPPVDTLSIDANGVVLSANDPFFRGFMSLDKKMVVGTTRDAAGISFQLRIIQTTGATFTMGDLAGAYAFSSLFDGASALWQYGTVTINSSGLTTFLSYLDSNAVSVLPADLTISMNAAGTITNAADATYHGTMSFNKDLIVSTFTAGSVGSEFYALSFTLK